MPQKTSAAEGYHDECPARKQVNSTRPPRDFPPKIADDN